MVCRAKNRIWAGGVSILVLAGAGMWVSGCGDSPSDEPQVTIISVEGDGKTPSEISSAIIVHGTGFLDGDQVEVCDAETGIRKTGGVLGTSYVDDTRLELAVDPSAFETGETKTIVSRDGVPKAIKGVTYLSGPTYVAGDGIDIDDATDVISAKLSATGGLDNTLGVDSDELGLMSGTVEGQILKWNETNSEWQLGVDEGGAGSGTVDVIQPGSGIAVDATDPAKPTVSLIDGAADGQVLKWNAAGSTWELGTDQTGGGGGGAVDSVVAGAGIAVDSTDPANPEVGLIDGTAAGDILKWDGSTWQLAVDETGGAGTDTLQDVVERGGTVVRAADAADVVSVTNTGSSNGSTAIRAITDSTTGITTGVYGFSNSNAGYGVYARSSNIGLHARGTNKAAEFDGLVDALGDVTVGGALTLTNDPPGAPMEAATKKYVDDSVAAAGGGDITGVTAGAGLTGGGPGPGDVTLDVSFGTAAGTVAEGDHTHTLQEVCEAGGTATKGVAGGATISAANTSSTGNSSGLYGYASAGTGATYGVWGRSDSSSGQGVYGWTNSATGITYGVHGTSDSGQGSGVYGHARRATGATCGVRGESDSDAGYGVHASGNNVGLYATGTNKAARFDGPVDALGDVNVTGSLTVLADSGNHPLEVVRSGSGGSSIRFKYDLATDIDVVMGANGVNMGLVGTTSNHNFAIMSNNQVNLHVGATGDVGIGTTIPANKLHVVGGGLTVNAGGASSDAIKLTAGSPGAGGLPGAQVSVVAGTGHNNVGGDVTVKSGVTSTWAAVNAHSTASLQGGDVDAGAGSGASLDVEGGYSISTGGSDAAGGNVVIRGGDATGNHAGGNIVLLPGTGMLDGNVGIGTTAPGAKLDVNGSVRAETLTVNNTVDSPAIKLTGPGAYGASIDFSNGAWRIKRDNASNDLMFVKVGGATFPPMTLMDESFANAIVAGASGVGIGTTAPSEMLHAAGNVRADGQLISGLGTGTAPLKVSSQTMVQNLNADMVDGFQASDVPEKDKLLALDAATAKFPNTALNTGSGNGLDADTVDGSHASTFVKKAGDTMTGTLTVPQLSLQSPPLGIDFSGWSEIYWDPGSGATVYENWASSRHEFWGDLFVMGGFTKFFVHDHPEDPTKQIMYACLEGPESGTYCRGTGQLSNGAATIGLPEHFRLVTADEGLTAQVTPTADCHGIYVAECGNTKIVVKELAGGKSNATFCWSVNGVRRGHEDQPVIRDKR